MKSKNKILDAVMGLCVADALGVPVEFITREEIMRNPVTEMRGYGTYNMPPGTWSDDTSMTLCLLDSLSEGLDYHDIMSKFQKWMTRAEYTPHGEVFDVGVSTRQAICRFIEGTEPLRCGGEGEHDEETEQSKHGCVLGSCDLGWSCAGDNGQFWQASGRMRVSA